MTRRGFRWGWLALLLPLLALLLIAVVMFRAQGGFAALDVPESGTREFAYDPAQVEHGAYLARLGNCVTCHSTRGGVPFAGGRPFSSPYGVLYSSNLTPDAQTGLGDWSVEEFRHAMRHGVSRTGLLYPAFPYAHFAALDDGDLDALFAYLRTLAPVHAPLRPDTLSFPAGWRNGALLAWRMLFHRPRPLVEDPSRGPEWNRGRYLVDGVGHCGMCHSGRGAMQSLPVERYMAGGLITGQGWYAPPLDEASLARWEIDELAGYLRSGVSRHGSAYGSMAEVIYTSLQYLTPGDATAMATYLKTIPPAPARRAARASAQIAVRAGDADGFRLYQEHCSDCHGRDGRGEGLHYPPLAGNPLVTADTAVNSVRLILFGGAAPATAANPRPRTMPPYSGRLSEADVAAVTNYIRNSWGNQARPVTVEEVRALRYLSLD